MKFTTWHYVCATCGRLTKSLQWDTDPAPVCCGQPMVMESSVRQTQQIITDSVPGGFRVENGFEHPQTFYSKSEHRQALAARGYRIADRGEWKHAGRA